MLCYPCLLNEDHENALSLNPNLDLRLRFDITNAAI